MRVPRAIGFPALALVAIFAILGLAVPLERVVSEGTGWDGLLDPAVLAVARATAWQAALSTIFAAVLGLPLGLAVGALGSRARARVLALLRIPYGVPTVVAGAAWVAVLGRSGVLSALDLAYTFSAVVIAHVFFNAPLVASLVAEARAGTSESYLEAARGLGASRLARFSNVLWPAIAPALASASAQVFALCSMSFALVLILGGGPPVDTLETALYARVRFGSLDFSGAVACALWQLAITLAPWALVVSLSGRAQGEGAAPRAPKPSASRALMATVIAVVFLLPYFAVFSPAGLAATFSIQKLAQLGAPALVSLQIAAASSLGALLFASAALIAAAWLGGHPGRAISILMSLPSGISTLVLGLGLWLAYQSWIDPFSGSLAAMCALQTLLFSPLAYRALWPIARGTRMRLLEAAATLGASPTRAFFAVEWPRWRGPLGGAGALVAGASLGEVAAVSLFYSENLVPLPLVVSRWMAQYRFEEAQGLSALLLVLSVGIVFAASEVTYART